MSELREGYKKTELGEIPIEWEVTDFKKFVFFQEGPGLRKWQFTLEGIKVINVTNITKGRLDLSKTNRYIGLDEYENKYKHFALKENDIVIASSGNSWGKTAFVEREHLPLLLNTSVIRFSPIDDNMVDLYYLWHFLNSNLFLNQIGFLITGSAQPNFGPYHLERIKISLPTFKEQQKIAEILSTVNEQIDNMTQLIEKTKELKKGLMQQLLTKGIGHTEFKQTELGEIPSAWSLKSFAEITDVLKCGVASTPQYTEEGVIFLSSQNVKENKIILDKYNFISKDYHEELTKKVKPQNGDILYTRVGANFGKAAVVNLNFEFSVYVSLTLIRLKEGYDEYFYMQLLNSEMYQKMAKNTVFQGGGVPNLNVKEVEKFQMLIPPLEEQQKIAQILSTVDEQIEVYEEEKVKYEELKKGLMQQLLTGQIRVKI